jgi:MYXO-CTERM domain-containing protein
MHEPSKILVPVSLGAAFLLLPLSARAADYYVATDGSDDNPGTLEAPFATVERGQEEASPGDTVFIREGVYEFSSTTRTVGVSFTKSGTESSRINYFAYPGERPIFDLFEVLPNARVTGFDVNCSYIHIRGIEIRGVQQIIEGDSWGVRIRGNGNILEHLDVHDCEAPGVFITSGADNLVLNCDSHHNYDPLEGGGNGDGFGCHSTGDNNVISGCRAYANSDDGYDFINAPGTCIVERSFAFRNGYIPDTTTASGNGAGFKAGGFGLDQSTFPAEIPRHAVHQCVAFGNRSQGFYANHHPGGIDFFNNVAFRNGVNFNMLADVGESSHTLRNNVAMSPGTAITNFSGGTDDSNSWTLNVSVSADDFLSVDEALALAPRNADGSLPDNDFMRLATGSDLIDAGEDVGLPFAGDAPDLGAFESGLAAGTGGTSGAGGSAGAATGGTSGAASGGVAGTSSVGGGTSGGSGNGGASGNGAQAGAGAEAGGSAGAMSSGAGGVGSGGVAASGGTASGTGGASTSGGTANGGGHAAGASGAAAGTSGASTDVPAEDAGCTCRSAGGTTRPGSLAALALLAAASLVRRTRRELRERCAGDPAAS